MHRLRHTRFHQMEVRDQFPETEYEARTIPLGPTPASLAVRDALGTCAPDDTSPRCEKPASSPTLAIILGSAIPIVCALFVLLWLHRRSTKKLQQEEMNDKTKSMDFGMEFSSAGGKGLQKTNGEKKSNNRQLSMDLSNPYLLPAGLNGSHDSLHSLTRSLNANGDRYGVRPGTGNSNIVPPPSPGLTSHRHYAPSHHSNLAHSQGRESSIYEQSIHDGVDSPNGSTTSMSAELLKGAQNMPISSPPQSRNTSLPAPHGSAPELKTPTPPAPAATRPYSFGLPPTLQVGSAIETSTPGRDSYIEKDGEGLHEIRAHVPLHTDPEQDIKNEKPSTLVENGPSITISETPQPLSSRSDARPASNSSHYAEDATSNIEFRFSTASPEPVEQPFLQKQSGRDTLAPGLYGDRRLSMGFRPLPPEGSKDESAEERAMRIRSFYKEYFDESAADGRPTSQVAEGGYYDVADDYMPGHQDDATPVYDPASDRFVIPGAKPFAEPPTRRAMTPPPRMPQQYQPSRVPSSQSARFVPPGPRSFSSASGRVPPVMARRARPIVPPQPLHILPTPAALKEDAFASPIMFAPPPRIQEFAAGARPISPGLQPGTRAYTPTVPAHIPLHSAFEGLTTLSAPHALRKSGTYTTLDFAPPRKFKNEDSLSDAGSIRSNKTGVSQLQAIRSGAYRVSRLPQDVVPLKDSLTAHLKPTMDLSQRY